MSVLDTLTRWIIENEANVTTTVSYSGKVRKMYHSYQLHFIVEFSWMYYAVSNHQRLDCLLNRLFRRRSKKTSKLRVTGLCVGISPVTGEFPAQRASNAENVSIWWRHYDIAPFHTEGFDKHSNLHISPASTKLHGFLFQVLTDHSILLVAFECTYNLFQSTLKSF